MNRIIEWQKKYYAVAIDINDNKTVYQTAKQRLEERQELANDPLEISAHVYDKMVEQNQYVTIQVYPSNGIASYELFHYDILKAVEEMDEILKEEE